MNIKQISDNLLCSGCGTCGVLCPCDAISMKKTPAMGLLHAEVDKSICTECGLCLKMCPSLGFLKGRTPVKKEDIIGSIINSYVARSLDDAIFNNAQSGGLVTQVLSYLFDKDLIDAVVSCRMDYGKGIPNVHYTIITSKNELFLNQKSCYTQVDIVSALKYTSLYDKVAVVGIPCQIQGVVNLSQLSKYKNIKYKLGLICDKSYSDTLMGALLGKTINDDIIINYRLKNFTHKGKYHTYKNAPVVVRNSKEILSVIQNKKRMFLKDYFSVPKCKLCADKLNVNADIVFGDPWGLTGMYDEKHGDSVVITRTKTGDKLISSLIEESLIRAVPASIDEIARGQYVDRRVNDINTVDWNAKVEEWRKYEKMSKEDVVKLVNSHYRTYKLRSDLHRVLGRIKRIFIK